MKVFREYGRSRSRATLRCGRFVCALALPLVCLLPVSSSAAPSISWVFPAGGQRGTTVTMMDLVAVRPWLSVAVATKVVVCDGDTAAEPVNGRVPEATGGEIEKDAALVTCQDSVVLCP